MTDTSTSSPAVAEPVRTRILARAAGQDIVTMDIPGFGPVRVRRLSTGESLKIVEQSGNPNPRLAVAALVDEAGTPLFEDVAALHRVDWALGLQLIRAVQKVNELKLEEAAGN